jgi:hypothetical protein
LAAGAAETFPAEMLEVAPGSAAFAAAGDVFAGTIVAARAGTTGERGDRGDRPRITIALSTPAAPSKTTTAPTLLLRSM